METIQMKVEILVHKMGIILLLVVFEEKKKKQRKDRNLKNKEKEQYVYGMGNIRTKNFFCYVY